MEQGPVCTPVPGNPVHDGGLVCVAKALSRPRNCVRFAAFIAAALLTVAAPTAGAQAPVITQQPTSVTANALGTGAIVVSARGAGHTLFLTDGGTLWAMGPNDYGQLGDGTTANRSMPVQVSKGVASMAAGSHCSLFVKTDGTLWAMGINGSGQLGDGWYDHRTVPVQIASGVASVVTGGLFGHSLFIKTDGTLWAMGSNDRGQLGDGTLVSRRTPVQVATEVASVAAGEYHSLFIKTDGTLWAMGFNGQGQLGDGTTSDHSTPVQVASDVTSVAAGSLHSLFVKTDGTLWVMGYNAHGQLGDGTAIGRSTPVQVASGVASAPAGSDHSLFVKTDGTLWAMGWNYYGQLGDGTTTDRTTPVQVAAGVATVAAGSAHSVFIGSDGTLWAMGANWSGQLGEGTTTARTSPIRVGAVALSVTATGTAPLTYQWKKDGVNIAGATSATYTLATPQAADAGSYTVVVMNALGSTTSNAATLTVVVPPSITTHPVSQTVNSPGERARFSVVASGTAPLGYRWLKNGVNIPWADGGFTTSDLADYQIPEVKVSHAGNYSVIVRNDAGVEVSNVATLTVNLPPVITVQPTAPTAQTLGTRSVVASTGGSYHTLFLTDDGTLWATGSNDHGQLGDGTTTSRSTPVQVSSGVASVSARTRHSLFVKTDGTLWAMGWNYYGQLGDGTTTGQSTPTQVSDGVASASAGGAHSLFVKTDGTLWAMGYNAAGQLGDGMMTNLSTPVQVADGVASASAGAKHSLFVKTDGTLWAMGSNDYGQLGDGTTVQRLLPVQVASGVASVTAGYYHSLFVRTDGTLWAMGQNGFGRLGDGTKINRSTPVQVGSEVASASAGDHHSLFVKNDGALWGMGDNYYGQLGDETWWTDHSTPVQVASGVASASAGGAHSLFVKTDGTLWGTGDNGQGQLGDGMRVSHYLPVRVASVTLSVTAIGPGPLAYQWKKDGVDIAGATSVTYYIASLQAADAGSYTVLVTNAFGSTASDAAMLTIISAESPPVIDSHPVSQTVKIGWAVTFNVAATGPGPGPLTYQWLKGSVPIPGANGPSYSLSSAQNTDAGSYSVVVSNSFGSTGSNVATLTVAPPRLVNLSTRARAGAGGSTLVVGFYIAGTGSKTVLIRGVGPELARYGAPNFVADPALKLYSGETVIAENDDWDASLSADFSTAGAFALLPDSKDAAMKITLGPGAYTIHLINAGAVAEALVEIYDLSQDFGTRFVNLSCRMSIAPGGNGIIGTYVSGGDMNLVARNVGVGLAPYLHPDDRPFVLPDPSLRFYSGQTVIAENDDWDAPLEPWFSAVGAFALPADSKDAAYRLPVGTGGYTIHCFGNGPGGILLMELYESP
ncbi:MAG TPA: immunoglobulin domain-containing protein [Opitutaceae bacterium]|nr:immunoglobulin domain-containing protein [Opitutaceae bacterium]